MREFAFGTSAQFAALNQELSQGKYYKFANRQLPMCSPPTATIWFAKKNDVYVMYIDKGITTASDNQDLRHLLANGETKFICFDDMTAFLHSLQSLYPGEEVRGGQEEVQTSDREAAGTNGYRSDIEGEVAEDQTADGNNDKHDVPAFDPDKLIDKKKLQEIKTENGRPKQVWPDEISGPLKQKIFGQDTAIDALADAVVINQMNTVDKLLVIALLGPPATGKSETGRSLAEVLSGLYGRHYGFIEIAASEYIEEHMVHKFLGAPPGYIGHGGKTVLDPVRSNPYHVILINEIEKANEKMLVALMEAMDTGRLGMADNSEPIDLNKCILLFTSNIPVNMDQYLKASEFERSEMCKDAFTKHCGRPEISRRIQDFMVFVSLSEDAEVNVILKFAKLSIQSYGGILVHVDEQLMAEFLKHKTKYGASEIGNYVSKAIGRSMLRKRQADLVKDKSVTVKGTVDNIEFELS